MTQFAAVTYQTVPWVSRIPPDLISKRQASRIPKTYEAAVPVSIADAQFDVDGGLAALAEEASHLLMRADEDASHSISAAPLAAVLLRTESAASSQIEYLTVSARQLAIAEIGQAASSNAHLVAANVDAMRSAIDIAGAIDEAAILRMHEALMRITRRAKPGEWRDEQVWIGSSGLSPADAAYVPPVPQRVPEAMADLVAFMQRGDLPVIVHCAVAHAQFETVHPFIDGNGRTGRAVMHAMMRWAGITRFATVPVSAGLLSRVDDYVAALTAFRYGDIRPIVQEVAHAAERAVRLQRQLTDELASVEASWREAARPRRGSALARLIGLAIGQPALNVETVVRDLGVSRTAARYAIDQAVTTGILTPASDKKRNRIWLAQDVLDALDAFAARAERRIG